MELPTPPAVTLAAGYTDDHGADTRCAEQHLWLAVIAQAATDLVHRDPRIRADSISFFKSNDLLLVMNLAAIDRDLAPALRAKAKELAEAPPKLCRPNAKRISYRGQTHSLVGWTAITNVSIDALSYRLRAGWSVARALTTPGRSGRQRRLDRNRPGGHHTG